MFQRSTFLAILACAIGCADMGNTMQNAMNSAGKALKDIKFNTTSNASTSNTATTSSSTSTSGAGVPTSSTSSSSTVSTTSTTGTPEAAPAPAPAAPPPAAPAPVVADASAPAPAPAAAPAEAAPAPAPAPEPEDPNAPMSPKKFSKLLNDMKGHRSGHGREVTVDADGQLALVKDAAGSSKFSCKQMKSVIKTFDFQEDKLRALKIIFPVLADQDGLEDVPKLFDDGGYEQGQAKKVIAQ